MTALGRRQTCLQYELLSSVESFEPLFMYICEKQESHCTVNGQAVQLLDQVFWSSEAGFGSGF